MSAAEFIINENFDFTPYKSQDSPNFPVSYAEKPCIICSKPSTIVCPECQKFNYCGLQHQKLHWRTHQFDCPGQHAAHKPRKSFDLVVERPSFQNNNSEKEKELNITKKSIEKDKKSVEKETGNVVRFQDTKTEKLSEDREKIRREMIAFFTSFRYSDAVHMGQKLVKISYKIYEITNKRDSREFYEYCADHLLLVKGLIKNEQIQMAKDQLILIIPMITRIIDRSEKLKEIAKTTDISSMEFINLDIDILGYHKKLLINNELKRRANLLSLVASALYIIEDFKNCEMLFVKYVKLIEKNYGSKSLEMSNCYYLIGGFYYNLDYFVKALESFKRSFEIRKAKLGEKHDSVGDCWYNLALVYKRIDKPMKALLLLEKAYDQKKNSKGELSLACALILEVIGKVFLENGNYKASLTKFQECYNIRKKLLNNAKHPELIRIALLIMHLTKLVTELVHKRGSSDPALTQLQEYKSNFSSSGKETKNKFGNATELNSNNPASQNAHRTNANANNSSSQSKNNIISGEVDEEHVFIAQPPTSTSGRFHKNQLDEYNKENDNNSFEVDLPLDPDFLASLSVEQLMKFSELRKKIATERSNINVADEILESEFINSLNGLQYNTFMIIMKKYLNSKTKSSIYGKDYATPLFNGNISDIKQTIRLQPVINDEEINNNDLNSSKEFERPKPKNSVFLINSNKSSPQNPKLSFIETIKEPGDRLRLNSLPEGDGKRNPFYDSEGNKNDTNNSSKILIPIPASIFQKVGPPQISFPPEYYYYYNQNPEFWENYSHNGNLNVETPMFTRSQTPNYYQNESDYQYAENPYRITLGAMPEGQRPKVPVGGVAMFGSEQNDSDDIQNTPNNQFGFMAAHYQSQTGTANLSPQYFGTPLPLNLLGGPTGPPNLLGGGLPLQPNILGGGPPLPPNILGGGPLLPPNLLGGGPPLPPNILGGGPPLPPNLLGGGPPLPPNLLGGPPGPPNLLGGGPPLPPNLLGGPPGPPNLLGGPPGPPNLLGGPKLPGLPGLGPPKLPGMGGISLKQNVDLGPKSKTKPFFWETLPQQQIGQSIWTEANKLQNEEIKFDDLEDVFENVSPQKGSPLVEAKKKPEVICLIADDKKANNMNIMLSKFKKYSMEELKQALIQLDPKIINLESAQALLRFPPETEELNNVRNYDGPLENLDLVSQFYLAIKDIPRYQPRLRTVILREEFDERFSPAVRDIEIIEKACLALKNNENFKRFLKLVLDLGNKMNSGSNRGNALGFKLSSLMALMNLKSNKDSRTLFQYIMEKIHQQKPEILEFSKEFEILAEASKINIDDPLKELDSLNSQMNNLRNNIDSCLKAQPPDIGFADAFKDFKEKNMSKTFEYKEKSLKIKNQYVEIAKLYGEDDATLMKKTSGEFFSTLVAFNEKVKKFLKDLEDKRIKEEKANKLKK